jgi:hypothetical protein
MMRNIQTREGFEFWDKLNALPRYAFLLSPSGKSVQKFEDQAMGNWIDVHEAQKVVDQAEERINERQDELREVSRQLEQFRERCHGIKNLSAIESRDDQVAVAQLKINELQQRLNAADQRIDELERGRGEPVAYTDIKELERLGSIRSGYMSLIVYRDPGALVAPIYAAPPAPVAAQDPDIIHDAAFRNGVMHGYSLGTDGSEDEYQKCIRRLTDGLNAARRERKDANIDATAALNTPK